MTTLPERQKYVEWITTAVENGARKKRACQVAGLPIRTLQNWFQSGEVAEDRRPLALRTEPRNKLSNQERELILATCNQKEYANMAPSQIVPALADQGIYLASESSFYRILNDAKQLKHRGREKQKGTYSKPTSYTAVQANEVWSWDITYLPGAVKGSHYYLYMIEDIYSRKIVGWEVHSSEEGQYAATLLQKSVWAEKCVGKKLILHSDNGSPMKSFTMQAKMYDLGITGSRSRPRVSNDNPFSESLFRTLKYRRDWPKSGFASLEAARIWVNGFVSWYNNKHRHSGIKFVTPHQRHEGLDDVILNSRDELYRAQKALHPARWSSGTRNWVPAGKVELNPENRERAA